MSEFYEEEKEENSPSVPETLGKGVSINLFVYAVYAENLVTIRSHSVFIFYFLHSYYLALKMSEYCVV